MSQQSVAWREDPRNSLTQRVRSALRRRLHRARRRLTGSEHRPHMADACRWLTQQAARARGGLPFLADHHAGNCGLTAAALPVLAACGQRELVQDLLAWV